MTAQSRTDRRLTDQSAAQVGTSLQMYRTHEGGALDFVTLNLYWYLNPEVAP